MLIRELIAHLESIANEKGNIPVYYCSGGRYTYEISDYEFIKFVRGIGDFCDNYPPRLQIGKNLYSEMDE